MAFSYAKFDRYAGRMVADLMHDFGLKDFQAAAFPGQTAAESRWMTDIIEDGAIAKGQAGGTGWFQDTGPRRREFEAWLKRKNYFGLGSLAKAADSYAGNYSFLFRELIGPEKAALAAVRRTTTLAEAAEVVCRRFERPRDPAASMTLRVKGTQRALDLYHQTRPSPTEWPGDHPAVVDPPVKKEPDMPATPVEPAKPADPPALPWWQSGTFVGANFGWVGAGIAAWALYNPALPLRDQVMGPFGAAAAAAISSAYAALKRLLATAQPLTWTQHAADQISRATKSPDGENVASEESQLPAPIATAETSLEEMPLSKLASELPRVVEALRELSGVVRPESVGAENGRH